MNDILKDPRKVPTFDHVLSRLQDHVAGYNSDADHARQDMQGFSPNQALAAWCNRKRVLADPQALDLCVQHWCRPATVGRNGISIAPRGKTISYGQYDDNLRLYKGTGRKLRVSYDPADLRTIRVYDESWRFLCAPTMNGMIFADQKISIRDVSDHIREQRHYRKAKREVAANAHHEYLSAAEQLSLKADDRREKASPPAPPAIKLVQTSVDGQSKALQNTTDTDAAPRCGQVDIGDFLGDLPALPSLREDEPAVDILEFCRDLDQHSGKYRYGENLDAPVESQDVLEKIQVGGAA